MRCRLADRRQHFHIDPSTMVGPEDQDVNSSHCNLRTHDNGLCFPCVSLRRAYLEAGVTCQRLGLEITVNSGNNTSVAASGRGKGLRWPPNGHVPSGGERLDPLLAQSVDARVPVTLDNEPRLCEQARCPMHGLLAEFGDICKI